MIERNINITYNGKEYRINLVMDKFEDIVYTIYEGDNEIYFGVGNKYNDYKGMEDDILSVVYGRQYDTMNKIVDNINKIVRGM